MPAVIAVCAGQAYHAGVISATLAGTLWTLSAGWVGAGCLVNALSCGRVHCIIDGIAFPALAVVGALNTLSVISFSWNTFWGAAFVVLAASFVPEAAWKRYA